MAWVDEHLAEIYAGLAESPASVESTHRFFAPPSGQVAPDASRQVSLLYRMGRVS